MTTAADRNDLVPTQKLEWVTPKISLLEAGNTEGKDFKATRELVLVKNQTTGGPS